jgi:hypothetical protein
MIWPGIAPDRQSETDSAPRRAVFPALPALAAERQRGKAREPNVGAVRLTVRRLSDTVIQEFPPDCFALPSGGVPTAHKADTQGRPYRTSTGRSALFFTKSSAIWIAFNAAPFKS